MRLQTIAIFGLTLAGFALRLYYLTTTHPFFDEYTTVLAARQTLRHGWPLLPSGLFYEHGLLATYLITPFTALFINLSQSQWQPAHWGLMLARWPSAWLGTLTIPLIYTLGRRALRPMRGYRAPISLLAAGLFALSPEGMVWGGRARMYALATLLVLLTVYWAYKGAVYPAPARYRWLALLALLATLLTQFGAMMLVPALVVAMLIVGWGSFEVSGVKSHVSRFTPHVSRLRHPATRNTQHATRPWFLRRAILPEGVALAAIVGLAIFVKRLGQPIGFDPLTDTGGNFVTELVRTITYQTTIYFTWGDTLEFLARQFGVPHHLWLTIATIVGAVIGLAFWFAQLSKSQVPIANSQSPNLQPLHLQSPNLQSINYFILFLWLTFGLLIIEMVTLLEPFRRNPRYIVMYLPLFYLMAAHAIFNIRYIFQPLLPYISRIAYQVLRNTQYALRNTHYVYPTVSLLLLTLFTTIGFNDLRIALLTPEPAYEKAFAKIMANWQPGDTLLTMNTPAAGLYLGHADGFPVQEDAEQFLLNSDTKPVDRWLGAPWLGTVADFSTALNNSPRTWYVIDTIRQPIYFRGNWQAVVNTQMEQLWTDDNVIVYRSRPNRPPLSIQPKTTVTATLGNAIQLVGYTIESPNLQTPISNLRLTLFWQPDASLSANYTTFLHVRDAHGNIVAQRDTQPLDGAYPTSYWQPDEIVIDPITLPLPTNLPPGTYTLYTGLYRLDTLERLSVANDTTGENAIRLGEVELP